MHALPALLRMSTVGLSLDTLSDPVMIAKPNSGLVVLAGDLQKFLFQGSKAPNSELKTIFVSVSTAILTLFRFRHHKYGLQAAAARAQECLDEARKATLS